MSAKGIKTGPSRKLPTAFYDKLYYVSRSNATHRFRYLKPQPIRQLFAKRPSHYYAQKFATDCWHKTLTDQLEFLAQSSRCDEYDLSKVEQISHNVFGWSFADYLKRRRLENCTWIEIVLKNSTDKCLEKQKVITDLREIKKFVDVIYKVIVNGIYENKRQLMTKLWQPLREIDRFSYIQESLEDERAILQEQVKDLQRRFITVDVVACLKEQMKQVTALEELVMTSDVWTPIELRYEINWYRCIVNQKQCQLDISDKRYEQAITSLNHKMINEQNCSSNTLNNYYSDTEEYKYRIRELQHKFDMDFEELETDANFIKSKIDQLQFKKNFLLSEIDRFHFEIERRLEIEEKRRLQEEEDRLAQEALVEEAKLKKLEALKKKAQTKRKKF